MVKVKGTRENQAGLTYLVSHRLSAHYRTLWSTLRGGSFPEIVLKTSSVDKGLAVQRAQNWAGRVRSGEEKGRAHL